MTAHAGRPFLVLVVSVSFENVHVLEKMNYIMPLYERFTLHASIKNRDLSLVILIFVCCGAGSTMTAILDTLAWKQVEGNSLALTSIAIHRSLCLKSI